MILEKDFTIVSPKTSTEEQNEEETFKQKQSNKLKSLYVHKKDNPFFYEQIENYISLNIVSDTLVLTTNSKNSSSYKFQLGLNEGHLFHFETHELFITKRTSAKEITGESATSFCFYLSCETKGVLVNFIDYLAKQNKMISHYYYNWCTSSYGSSYSLYPYKEMNSFFWDKEKKESLLADMKAYVCIDEFDVFYPGRRNYLFRGPSGSGKTSIIKNLSSTFDMDIKEINLQHPKATDDRLKKACVHAGIVVFNNIDTINANITYDCLASLLNEPHLGNRVIIMTTTKPSSEFKFPESMKDVIHKEFEFGFLLNKTQISALCNNMFLKNHKEQKELTKSIVNLLDDVNVSFSQLKKVFDSNRFEPSRVLLDKVKTAFGIPCFHDDNTQDILPPSPEEEKKETKEPKRPDFFTVYENNPMMSRNEINALAHQMYSNDIYNEEDYKWRRILNFCENKVPKPLMEEYLRKYGIINFVPQSLDFWFLNYNQQKDFFNYVKTSPSMKHIDTSNFDEHQKITMYDAFMMHLLKKKK